MGNRILVKPDPIEELTEGGIYIPDQVKNTHENAQQTGLLVAAGQSAWDSWKHPWAKIGDRVMFARYGGTNLIGSDGDKYRLINDEQLAAQVDPDVNLTDMKARERSKV